MSNPSFLFNSLFLVYNLRRGIFMKILTIIEGFIFQTQRWKFILMMFGLLIVKTGIWYIPNIDATRAMAQNPFVNPFESPLAHYLFWSWLGPYLGWLIGATGKWSYFLFLLAFSLAFTFIYIAIVFSKFSDRVARTSIVLFMLLPASATVYFWVGYDSLLVFLMFLAIAFTKYRILTFLLGVGIGMQHFEMGLVSSAALLAAILLNLKFKENINYSIGSAVALLAGIIAGKLALMGIFAYYGIELNSGRTFYFEERFQEFLKQFFFHSQLMWWSILGVGWVVALKYTDRGSKTIPFFLALFGLSLFLFLVADHTRVVAIITFPLLAVYWLFNESFLKGISTKEASGIFVLWVLVPFTWVWEGLPRWSSFPYDVVYGLHRLFGWFSVPDNYPMWPFQ